MDTFSYYKEGINCLNVPDYSIEQISNAKRHKKYIQKKKIQKWVSMFIFILSNQYDNTFWIVACQGDEGRQINVTAKSNQYVLQLSFLGYEIGEVHEVLNEFNLA